MIAIERPHVGWMRKEVTAISGVEQLCCRISRGPRRERKFAITDVPGVTAVCRRHLRGKQIEPRPRPCHGRRRVRRKAGTNPIRERTTRTTRNCLKRDVGQRRLEEGLLAINRESRRFSAVRPKLGNERKPPSHSACATDVYGVELVADDEPVFMQGC